MTKIVIDSREHALGASLEKMGCAFEFKMLDVGDIELYAGCEDDEPMLTVERKTLEDLASSLSDGRYSEQRLRLMDHRGIDRIAYVIEGRSAFSSHSPGVRGALMSLSLKHRIQVIRTENVDDTAFFVMSALKKLKEDRESTSGGGGGYAGAACRASCVKKRDNVDPHQCFLHQLSQIPGVSYVMAVRIAAHPGFESMRNMISKLDSLSGDKDRRAEFLSIDKIGPKLADRLITYLYTDQLHAPPPPSQSQITK
jgi:ERCC4-type nuclease